jgi:hypothetical protein
MKATLMRAFLILATTALTTITSAAQTAVPELPPASTNIMTWARLSPPAFGCLVEKKFGYRDSSFNCSTKKYHSSGDPCTNPTAYYAGPAFPKNMIQKLNPMVTDIELSWEHGQLQQIIVLLKGNYPEPAVRRAFQLPATSVLPNNVTSVSVESVTPEVTSVSIVGFDHSGGGDVECPKK